MITNMPAPTMLARPIKIKSLNVNVPFDLVEPSFVVAAVVAAVVAVVAVVAAVVAVAAVAAVVAAVAAVVAVSSSFWLSCPVMWLLLYYTMFGENNNNCTRRFRNS